MKNRQRGGDPPPRCGWLYCEGLFYCCWLADWGCFSLDQSDILAGVVKPITRIIPLFLVKTFVVLVFVLAFVDGLGGCRRTEDQCQGDERGDSPDWGQLSTYSSGLCGLHNASYDEFTDCGSRPDCCLLHPIPLS